MTSTISRSASATSLPMINIFNKDGTLNDDVPAPYRGLSREAARKKIVADLEAAGPAGRSRAHHPCRAA